MLPPSPLAVPMKKLLLVTLALAPLSMQLSAEPEALATVLPPAGQKLKEDTAIRLRDGKFTLALGDKALAGAANAFLHDKVERTLVSADSQKVAISESLRNIALSFGGKGGEPKDQPSVLAGKKIVGTKTSRRWVFAFADDHKPTTEEAKALNQFAGYTEFSEVFAQLYGTEPRSVGDSWKPDLSSLKHYAADLNAEITCKLEDIGDHDGVRCAHVTVQGRISGKYGDSAKVDIEISGTVYRDLVHLIDAEMDLTGTFKFEGALGGGGKNAAESFISAPLTLKRTVKPADQ
jgi:hypothetical protein